MGAMLGAILAEAGEAATNGNPPMALAASRPATAGSAEAGGLQDLVSQLRGVPRGALKTVLGKELGARIWRQARGKTAAADGAVRDAEVVAGLIGHLSRLAAEELRKNERQAKFVRLTVWYQDGSSASERARLAGLTQDAAEILAAAVRLFERFEQSPGQTNSVNLDVTAGASATNAASEPSRVPGWLAMPVRTAAG
jgi:nucleotidyltransferase/DNA polymerase involved in DNA repair